jgi:hypothetical protein
MAPESISDRVFSSESDVWSYGVLCWEVFTVADRPFADLTADKTVEAIARGKRLPRPDQCPEEVYVPSLTPNLFLFLFLHVLKILFILLHTSTLKHSVVT